MRFQAWVGAVLLAGLAAGCGTEGQAEGAPAADDAGRMEAAGAELIKGTPPGGLVDWVEEIREGTVLLEEMALEDRGVAQRAALDLYIGRQEYLELYYGTAGREIGSPALGEAVIEAEARFHALLQLLSSDPVDTAAVRAGTAGLHEQLDVVLAEAKAANVPAVLPGNVPVR